MTGDAAQNGSVNMTATEVQVAAVDRDLLAPICRALGTGRLAKVGSGDPIGVTWWPLHQLDPVAVGVTEP